jgi:hypothetical protein
MLLQLTDFQAAVAMKLGYQFAVPTDSDELALTNWIVDRGIDNVYYPTKLDNVSHHEWSWFRPVTSFVLRADVATSTGENITRDSANTYTSDSATVFYDNMVGATLAITGGSPASSTITSVTDANTVVTEDDMTGTLTTYSITMNGDYEMPFGFTGLASPLTFTDQLGIAGMVPGPETRIRVARQRYSNDGRPTMCALVPKTNDLSGGQRYELRVWPEPDQDYTVEFRYYVVPNKLSAGNPYPLGGAPHSQTFLASCLAQAELYRYKQKGADWDEYVKRLIASIETDRNTMLPDTFGYMGDKKFSGRGHTHRYRADGRDYGTNLTEYTGGIGL